MKFSDQPTHVRHRLIALATASLVILVLAGIGAYGLIAGPRTPDTHVLGTPGDPVPAPPTNPDEVEIPGLSASTGPKVFAQNVAQALFSWDTASGHMPLDYTAAILEFADPAGTEQAGLASDIARYLPSREAWIDLRQYATAQSISVDEAYVPDGWAEALAQARPGQLPDGAIAVTVEGTRHRTGIWNDEPVHTAHPVAFTIFLTCPDTASPEPRRRAAGEATKSTPPAGPKEPTCFVMRLSMLDNPLR